MSPILCILAKLQEATEITNCNCRPWKGRWLWLRHVPATTVNKRRYALYEWTCELNILALYLISAREWKIQPQCWQCCRGNKMFIMKRWEAISVPIHYPRSILFIYENWIINARFITFKCFRFAKICLTFIWEERRYVRCFVMET